MRVKLPFGPIDHSSQEERTEGATESVGRRERRAQAEDRVREFYAYLERRPQGICQQTS